MDEKQLAKLIKKNTERAEKAISKKPTAKSYDSTLKHKQEGDNDEEREQFFDQMKKREF